MFVLQRQRVLLWRSTYLSFTLYICDVLTRGSILLCSLPNLWITGVLPQKGVVLQHLTWEDIPECQKSRLVLILLDIVNYPLWTPNLHFIWNDYIHTHVMDHWRMPVITAPIFHATILDVMVNWINAWIHTYIELMGIIHIYATINLEFSPPPIALIIAVVAHF